jgi:hypothetical protein
MTGDWVECRSDHDYIGHPLAFAWQGQHFEVAEVVGESRTPGGFHFRVRTTDAQVFELDYDITTDHWTVNQP